MGRQINSWIWYRIKCNSPPWWIMCMASNSNSSSHLSHNSLTTICHRTSNINSLRNLTMIYLMKSIIFRSSSICVKMSAIMCSQSYRTYVNRFLRVMIKIKRIWICLRISPTANQTIAQRILRRLRLRLSSLDPWSQGWHWSQVTWIWL